MSRSTLAAAAVLLVGIALLALGWFVDPRRFFFSWLAAWTFYVGIAVGSLALVMLTHAVRARWFVPLRRLAEWPLSTLPVLLLLAVPFLLGLDHLYRWVEPMPFVPASERELVQHKEAWLNVPFFVARTFLWMALFSAAGWLLVRWSLLQDRASTAALQLRMQRFSAGALPPLALAVTFASFDWVMSLHPTWQSTIFGIYFFAGGFVGGLALLACAAGLHAGREPTPHLYALGKLLFAMVVFWAYVAFMQLLLIWIADVPHEVDYYLRRSERGWQWVSLLLGLVHFAVPFFVLLLRRVKRSPRALAAVGAWLLFAHYVDVYWLVLPVLAPDAPEPHFLDLAALAVIGAACWLAAAWRFRHQPTVAQGDLLLEAALRYEGS